MSNRARSLPKALIVAALALFIPALAAGTRPASAQEAPEVTAQTVASWAQTFYDQTEFVQARFQQHFWNRVYDRTSTSRGQMFISRPGRVRFDYAAPSGKVIVSDGSHFTYYEPGDDGAVGQYYEGSADSTSAALGFLTGTARLDRDFTFSLRPNSATQPPHTRALELRPRRPDPHFRRIVLYVSDVPATQGVVMRISIEDPDGNWNRFDFEPRSFSFAPIDAGQFNYTAPEGARRIDPPSSGS
jgi:outer membrane lipoprotein carrier protein